MADLHLSPTDVALLKHWHIATEESAVDDTVDTDNVTQSGMEVEAAAQLQRYREWCEFRRKRAQTLEDHHQWRIAVELQAEFERVTASEQIRALEAELRKAMKWYPRWKWTACSLLIAVALAIAGWGRG